MKSGIGVRGRICDMRKLDTSVLYVQFVHVCQVSLRQISHTTMYLCCIYCDREMLDITSLFNKTLYVCKLFK